MTRMRPRRMEQLAFGLMAVAALGLVIPGCGGAKKEPPEAGTTPAGGTPAVATPEGTGTTGDAGTTAPATGASTTPGGAATAKPAGALAVSATDPMSAVAQNAFAFVLVRPQRIYESKLVQALPKEMLDDALQNARGLSEALDLTKVEFIAASVLPPEANGDSPAANRPSVFMLRYAEPLDMNVLIEDAKAQGTEVTEQTHNGKKYWRAVTKRPDFSANPDVDMPEEPKMVEAGRFAVVSLDPKTAFGGTEANVLKMLDGNSPGVLHERLKGVPMNQDLVVAVIPGADRQAAMLATMASGSALPEDQGEKLAEAVEQTRAVLVTLDLTGGSLLGVTVEGLNKDAADKLETSVTDGRKSFDATYKAMTAQFRGDAAPAMYRDLAAYGDKVLAGLSVERKGTDVTVAIKNPGDLETLVAMVKPAIEQAQNAAKSSMMMNNLKQVGLSFHNYHDVHNSLPVPKEAKGKGLSWRVHLLPYLDEAALYNEFNLDEPWDSEHNKALIERMPKVFTSTDSEPEPGKTRVVGFAGEGAVFGSETGIKFADVKDGLSNTILAVEAAPDKAVIWTKPDDLKWDPKDPLAALGKLTGEISLVMMMDGAVRKLPKAIDKETLKALITISGGEEIDDSKLQ